MRQTLAFAVLAAALSACGTSVQRMDAGEVKDVSGRWNDTDARLVAEEMIQDSISRPWLEKATQRKGGAPTVIVMAVSSRPADGFVGATV